MKYKLSFLKNIFFFSLLLVGCNVENKEVKQSFKNLSVDDSLVRNIKFNVYCIFADKKFAFIDDSINIIDYSQCDLLIDTLSSFSDTLELGLHFFYNKRLVDLNYTTKENKTKVVKILYDTTRNKIIQYITNWGMGFYNNDSSSRYYIHIQPDVIEYIKNNTKTLNPWFKNESVRRGILPNGTTSAGTTLPPNGAEMSASVGASGNNK